MKFLLTLALTTLLIAGCSESSTQTINNESGSDSSEENTDSESENDTGSNDDTDSNDDSASDENADGENTDDESPADEADAGDDASSGEDSDDSSSTDNDSDSGNDDSVADDSDNSSDSDTGDESSDEDSTPEPAPESTSVYRGINLYDWALAGPTMYRTTDPRENYYVTSTSELKALAAIEGMHAINYFRETPITSLYSDDIDRLKNECPTSSENWTSTRCSFYADLAYNLTLDGTDWNQVVDDFSGAEVVCATSSETCQYNLLNEYFNTCYGCSDYTLYTPLRVYEISPIEKYNWLPLQRKIMRMNQIVAQHAACVGADEENSIPHTSQGWYASFWPGEHFTIWVFSNDVQGDVIRDISAQYPDETSCNFVLNADIMGL